MRVIIYPQNTQPIPHFEMIRYDKPLLMCREEPSSSEHSLENPPLEKATHYSKSWLVKVAQDVTIAARCRHVVTGWLVLEKVIEFPSSQRQYPFRGYFLLVRKPD
jgi:hypothetical protein